MGAGPALPFGYSLQGTEDISRLHAALPTRSSDWLVCSWFVQRKEICDKWWIIEWDTFCNTSATDYYAPVWHFPFVVTTVIKKCREPNWYWFRDDHQMPTESRPYLIGGVPFLYLIDDNALQTTCECLLRMRSIAGNGELRFATAANMCGFTPCAFSPPDDRISHISWEHVDDAKAIFHPVKHFVKAHKDKHSRLPVEPVGLSSAKVETQ